MTLSTIYTDELDQEEEWAELRDSIAERLTSDQIAEAQRLAREWNEAHPRD